jgi:hypothetical protein
MYRFQQTRLAQAVSAGVAAVVSIGIAGTTASLAATKLIAASPKVYFAAPRPKFKLGRS